MSARTLSLSLYGFLLLLAPLGFAAPVATNAPAGAKPSSAPTSTAKLPTASTPGAKPNAPMTAADAAAVKIKDSMGKMDKNDIDGALQKLNEAIAIDPKGLTAYVLRASLYCQKKQWAEAEKDFKTASSLAPTNVVLKFNLVEVKFMQKQFDAARAGYLPFVKDPDMGDLASYKIFLCDLYGGHAALAAKERAVFNEAAANPSYYFSNAAWALYNKNVEEARGWLVSASNIYPLRKNAYYANPLRDMGYLPLPPPSNP